MTEREEFEAWWMRDVPPEYRTMMPFLMERGASGKYSNPRAEGAWEVWQAARRTTPDREAWISVDERLPDEGQAIAFVVHWPGDEFLHGRVFGGTFHSYGGKMPTFSVPGIGFKATHWMPLPTAPNGEKGDS
ncbi:DUF551 domain-containing protein [Burkholderia anthina]|uniref:DUF551 domain-containing protein n=1 Tax=Burkholderia anthina TaxID=179879 RepID=UPI0029313AB7|nr:DUF551 domain-containing protein [Burkholderia anthina]WJN74414.1 hypothetical protein OH687_29315 [Burkholderia anthina]